MPKKSSAKRAEKIADAEGKIEKTAKKSLSSEEFEKKVSELAEQGLTSEKIGEKLRKEGIHPQEYGKKISKVMGKRYSPPELINIKAKLESLKRHIEKNKQDKRAIREKDRIFSHLRKLEMFYNK